ncbi:hypothetical protein HYE43_03745 [Mycoplasmopsis bovis]|nr:hypothetical protein HYE43_03745 [Mycoplasmopsis bovis]
MSSPDLCFSYFSNKYFHSLTLNCLAIFTHNKKTSANLLMSTFLSYCKNGSISSKTEKTNIGIIDENKKKELLKELDKQFSISPDYNVIEKAVQKYFKEIKKIDFWFNVLTKK